MDIGLMTSWPAAFWLILPLIVARGDQARIDLFVTDQQDGLVPARAESLGQRDARREVPARTPACDEKTAHDECPFRLPPPAAPPLTRIEP